MQYAPRTLGSPCLRCASLTAAGRIHSTSSPKQIRPLLCQTPPIPFSAASDYAKPRCTPRHRCSAAPAQYRSVAINYRWPQRSGGAVGGAASATHRADVGAGVESFSYSRDSVSEGPPTPHPPRPLLWLRLLLLLPYVLSAPTQQRTYSCVANAASIIANRCFEGPNGSSQATRMLQALTRDAALL